MPSEGGRDQGEGGREEVESIQLVVVLRTKSEITKGETAPARARWRDRREAGERGHQLWSVGCHVSLTLS